MILIDLVDLIWSSLMNSFILIDDISSLQVCLSDIMFLHNSAYFLSIFAIFIFGRQYSQFSILRLFCRELKQAEALVGVQRGDSGAIARLLSARSKPKRGGKEELEQIREETKTNTPNG